MHPPFVQATSLHPPRICSTRAGSRAWLQCCCSEPHEFMAAIETNQVPSLPFLALSPAPGFPVHGCPSGRCSEGQQGMQQRRGLCSGKKCSGKTCFPNSCLYRVVGVSAGLSGLQSPSLFCNWGQHPPGQGTPGSVGPHLPAMTW